MKKNAERAASTKNNTRERKLIDLPSVHTASCGTRGALVSIIKVIFDFDHFQEKGSAQQGQK